MNVSIFFIFNVLLLSASVNAVETRWTNGRCTYKCTSMSAAVTVNTSSLQECVNLSVDKCGGQSNVESVEFQYTHEKIYEDK